MQSVSLSRAAAAFLFVLAGLTAGSVAAKDGRDFAGHYKLTNVV